MIPNDPNDSSDWLTDLVTLPEPRTLYQRPEITLAEVMAAYQVKRLSELNARTRRPPTPRKPAHTRAPPMPRRAITPDEPDPPYLYVHDVAALLSVSTKTVRRWIAAHQLPARKLGHTGRSAAPWRISRLDWEAFQAGTTRHELSIDDIYAAFDHDNGRDDPDHIRRR